MNILIKPRKNRYIIYAIIIALFSTIGMQISLLNINTEQIFKRLEYRLKSVYLIATRDLSNLWLQFFLSQNQGFMRLFEKTVLK